MSIKGIALYHFSSPTQTETEVKIQERTHHAVFHSFFYDDRKQDSAKSIVDSKSNIENFKQRNLVSNILSMIWENTDGCAEQYRCSTVLYLMSMFSHNFLLLLTMVSVDQDMVEK